VLSAKSRRDVASIDSDGEDTGAGLGFGIGTRPMASSACCAAGEDVVVLDIFRSPLWSSNGREEVLKVEIPRAANIAGLRGRIAELYGLPEAAQRLQRTPELGGSQLSNTMPVAELEHKPVFLLPRDIDAEESDIQHLCQGHGREQYDDNMAMMRGVAESLKGVTYNIHFIMPEAAAASTALPKTLALDAMALIGDIQVMLEVEMMGGAGRMPLALIFNGQVLPPNMPLHFTGVRDGDSLAVVIAGPGFPCRQMLEEQYDDDDDDDDDDPVLRWVANS